MIDVWESAARTAAALAVVLALMGLVAWGAKRLLGAWGRMAGPAPLVQVLACGPIAPKKSIALVSVAGEYLIVGLTADQMVPLGRIDDPQRVQGVLAAAGESGPSSAAFSGTPAEWVRQIVDRFRFMPVDRQDGQTWRI